MKKVLVTGAAGTIGMFVIKYLLAEGQYEITALDLKTKNVVQKLRKYRKRINIVYGDVTDQILMEALVKGHDYIIHLASALPPLSDMKKGLATAIDYGGCENIVKAISYYNPRCYLFYASSTNVYKEANNIGVKSILDIDSKSYFAKSKIESEKLIKSKIKNYAIFRVPIVLGNPINEPFMYQVKSNQMVEVITKEDAAYAFVRGIKKSDELCRKTFNLSGDKILFKDLLNKLLEIDGLTWGYILNRLFVEKIYYSPVVTDGDELEKILHYKNDTLSEYFTRQKRRVKNRGIRKFLAKPFIKRK